jgi:hypothetical protein
MSQEYPEFLFVAGPQAGQRVCLQKSQALLGRGGGADIMLSEEYVSRQHARYELLQAGPTIESLSEKGIYVNGRRHKSGRKLLLETGDLVGLGQATELLFVAKGDDADAALAIYSQSNPQSGGAFGRKSSAPQPPPAEDILVQEEPEPSKLQPKKASAQAMDMTPMQRAAADRKAKSRKLMVMLGGYLAVLAVLFGLLLALRHGHKNVPDVPVLSDDQIEQGVEQLPELTPSPLEAQGRLVEALNLYGASGPDIDRLYACAQAFKEARAYSGRGFFSYAKDPHADDKYRQILRRLADEIKRQYREAVIKEKNLNWQDAENRFRNINGLYKDETSVVFRNVQLHLNRCVDMRRASEGDKRYPA